LTKTAEKRKTSFELFSPSENSKPAFSIFVTLFIIWNVSSIDEGGLQFVNLNSSISDESGSVLSFHIKSAQINSCELCFSLQIDRF